MNRWVVAMFLMVGLGAVPAIVRAEGGPLAAWGGKVTVRPVTTQPRHTIHTYYGVCPESPDGKWVLFYTSTQRDGGRGEVRIVERATGVEKVLAANVTVEDAHRAACQQWVSQGKRVVYHDERQGEWVVVAVEVATGQEQILGRGRQLGFGQPNADLVPMYGPHWNPGEHRDLEIYDLASGTLRVAAKADEVKAKYGEWVKKTFGERPISVFFPVLSPDLKRVIFKMASPAVNKGPNSRSSDRMGLVCYDLGEARPVFLGNWGHPAWHPDSKRIIDKGNVLLGPDGKVTKIPDLPALDHPAISPDGKLFAMDRTLVKGGKEWQVMVADIRGGAHVTLHQFDGSRGAASWRKSHPHPAFSADGKRIYFNVNSGDWTELWVAELP